jgi:CheY-like chemotaxis protein
LIVEDDEAMRRFAQQALESGGFMVDSAGHGAEALSRLHNGTNYDLVVLDIVLPWVNGLQVLSAMRAKPQTADLPVVIITGTAMTKHEFSGDKNLMVLRKPFDAERLVNTVILMLYGGAGA